MEETTVGVVDLENPATLEPQYFENGGRKFVYDFNILTVEQGELAREAAEFKMNQIQNEPDNFRQITKSKGAEWLSTVMSYLLREQKGGATQPFIQDKAENDGLAFVKGLNLKERKRLLECVNDFFTGIERAWVLSRILQGERKRSAIEILYPLMQKSGRGTLNEGV